MSCRAAVALAGLALGAAFLAGCPMPSSEDAPTSARQTIRAYLECEECIAGELDAVLALGETAVPTLGATLREGLSPASRARLVLQLRERYAGRVSYGEAHPGAAPSLSEEEFVGHHVGNRDALHRVRAAWALGRFRTPAAIDALRDALVQTQRPGVEQVIRRALGGA